MKFSLIQAGAVILTLLTAQTAQAKMINLTPANPQPSASQLTKGLSVTYGYAPDIKSLNKAEWAVNKFGEPGPDLRGLDYPDSQMGEKALTSKQSEMVAAKITGYIKFDKAGVFDVDFVTNDGIRSTIGGQVVGEFDGRQTCQATFTETVNVPSAGWYELDILWFQRLNTSCLNMRWGPQNSQLDWVPNSVFAH
jgi:hypothetical protein